LPTGLSRFFHRFSLYFDIENLQIIQSKRVRIAKIPRFTTPAIDPFSIHLWSSTHFNLVQLTPFACETCQD
jgi:hypothetical protein